MSVEKQYGLGMALLPKVRKLSRNDICKRCGHKRKDHNRSTRFCNPPEYYLNLSYVCHCEGFRRSK
jgi:hypothetical protein